MNEQTIGIINTLIRNGGKLWEKGNMRRIYLSPQDMGLDVRCYTSGGIRFAAINGQEISNADARYILDARYWFDLEDGQFHSKDISGLGRRMYEDFQAKIQES